MSHDLARYDPLAATADKMAVYRSTRTGMAVQTHPRHRYFNLLDGKDRVARAIAWDDGGAEFVFGDGSVLSFCDDMNTFVACTPSSGTGATVATQSARRRSGLAPPPPTPDGSVLAGASLYDKDMLFTAWTLSRYTAKVAAALGVYNCYSARPRLIEGLVPAGAEVRRWRAESGAMDALVLINSSHLLERRQVQVMLSVPTRATPTATLPPVAEVPENISRPNGGTAGKNGGPPPSQGSSPTRTADVDLGVESTLWCALRRTALTLHANGATFSVCWPAPVAAQARNARASFIPADLFRPRHGATDGTDAGEEVRMALRDVLATPRLYTLLTQVFPVAAPPAVWADMLRLAMQLDAETPAGECFRPVSSLEDSQGKRVDDGEESGSDGTLYLTLPPTAASGTGAANTSTKPSHNSCRFSRMESEHASYLIASGSHVESAACNEAIHGKDAQVVWRYDADTMGREPHAVYWHLRPTPPGMDTQGRRASVLLSGLLASDLGGRSMAVAGPGTVLSAVKEDGSTLLVNPGATGYAVRHRRPDGSERSYHVSADGEVALPPSVGRLAFPSGAVYTRFSAYDNDDADHGGRTGVARGPSTVEVSHASFAAAVAAAANGPSPFYGATGDLTDFPALVPLWSASVEGTTGRYLPDVGAAAIRLSQRCLATGRTARAAEEQRKNTTWQTGGDGSTDSARPPSHSSSTAGADSSSVAFLRTRVDGVGNFTALDNGVVRVRFEDRTVLTLIPGPNDHHHHHYGEEDEDDEAYLVADCLFRDATRCLVRVVHCTAQHDAFRYVSFALPFRRFAMMRAAERAAAAFMSRHADGCNDGSALHAMAPSMDTTDGRMRNSLFRSHPQHGDDGAASGNRTGPTDSRGYSPNATPIQQQQQHYSLSPQGTDTFAPTQFGNDTASDFREAAPFSIHVTSWQDTVQDQALEHELEMLAGAVRLNSVLELSEAVSARNRSLLSEW